MEHHIRPDNALGLEPRPVTIYWHVNDLPQDWFRKLPRPTQVAVRSPFGVLASAPHLPIVFAHRGFLFRLDPAQLAFMVELHDQALKSRPNDVMGRAHHLAFFGEMNGEKRPLAGRAESGSSHAAERIDGNQPLRVGFATARG